MAAGLWDAESHDSVAGLYLLGLVAAGLLLDQLNLDPHWLVWTGTIVLAAYTVLTSYLWSVRRQLSAGRGTLENPGWQPVAAGRAGLARAGQLTARDRCRGAGIPGRTFVSRVFGAAVGRASGASAGRIDRALGSRRRRTGLQYAALALGVIASSHLAGPGWIPRQSP